MQKESSKIFIVLTPWWSNTIIFQSLSDIVVFSFPMWFLTCLVWICTITIQKNWFNLSKCCLFVQFRANSKRLKTGLGHFRVNYFHIWNYAEKLILRLKMQFLNLISRKEWTIEGEELQCVLSHSLSLSKLFYDVRFPRFSCFTMNYLDTLDENSKSGAKFAAAFLRFCYETQIWSLPCCEKKTSILWSLQYPLVFASLHSFWNWFLA